MLQRTQRSVGALQGDTLGLWAVRSAGGRDSLPRAALATDTLHDGLWLSSQQPPWQSALQLAWYLSPGLNFCFAQLERGLTVNLLCLG